MNRPNPQALFGPHEMSNSWELELFQLPDAYNKQCPPNLYWLITSGTTIKNDKMNESKKAVTWHSTFKFGIPILIQ